MSLRRWMLGACALLAFAGPAAANSHFGLAHRAGVYKQRFDNGTIDGGKYVSENIFELTPYGPRAAYFRLHLEFFNGHQCALWGIADMEGADLVYRERVDSSGELCELRIRETAKGLALDDVNGACRAAHCGARGGLGGQSFPASSRRPIRYLPRLLKSREYADAVRAYQARKAGRP